MTRFKATAMIAGAFAVAIAIGISAYQKRFQSVIEHQQTLAAAHGLQLKRHIELVHDQLYLLVGYLRERIEYISAGELEEGSSRTGLSEGTRSWARHQVEDNLDVSAIYYSVSNESGYVVRDTQRDSGGQMRAFLNDAFSMSSDTRWAVRKAGRGKAAIWMGRTFVLTPGTDAVVAVQLDTDTLNMLAGEFGRSLTPGSPRVLSMSLENADVAFRLGADARVDELMVEETIAVHVPLRYGNMGLIVRLAKDDIRSAAFEGGAFTWSALAAVPVLVGGLVLVSYRLSEARRLSHTDPLTGAFNRRGLSEWIDGWYEANESEGCKAAVLAVDIDRFKEVNDSFGHRVGDKVLVEVSRRLQSGISDLDWLCRWGGEEFVVVLSDPDPRTFEVVAERLRRTVSRRSMSEKKLQITISGGVTLWRPGEQLGEAVARADHLMYQGKQEGRDRIVSNVLSVANNCEASQE